MDYGELTQLVILLDTFWEWANLKPWDDRQVLHVRGLVSEKAEEVLQEAQRGSVHSSQRYRPPLGRRLHD